MISPISETHMLARKARAKLNKEAARGDHDLRILVAHANLLDNLMDKINNHQYEEPIKTTTFAPLRYGSYNTTSKFTVTFVQDEGDSSDEDEDDTPNTQQKNTSVTVAYDSDDDSDEDDDEFDFSSDEEYEYEEELEALSNNLTRINSANFRTMPTIEELSEDELAQLKDYSSEEEEVEVDVSELRKTPSLNYSSSTDDEEEEEEEEEEEVREQTDFRPEEVDFADAWNKGKDAQVLITDLSITFLSQNTPTVI